jgi:hypothetical protein
MSQRKNGPGQAYAATQSRRQTADIQPARIGVVPPKLAMTAQMKKQPQSPPVYRPQRPSTAMQPKTAHGTQIAKPPVAPSVYRPKPTQTAAQLRVTQTGAPVAQRKVITANGAQPDRKPPIAPPIYRPQPTPKVLQTKSAMGHQSKAGPAPRRPVAPAPFRSQTVQAKAPAVSTPLALRPAAPVAAKTSSTRIAVRGFRSSVINLMADVATAPLATALGYAYSEAEALLQADERTELDALWSANYRVTRNTSNSMKNARKRTAAGLVRTRLNAILAIPLVTYSGNFKTNHLSDADVIRSTAKTRGEARNVTPPHNTVFKESYLRGLLIADAAGKADGEHWLRFQSPHPASGRISLATRNGQGGMTAEDTGLYFVAVKYEVTTDADSRRQKTVRAFHIETDDD